MPNKTTTKYLSIVVAVLTFVGIALHDTKLDTLAKFAIALPAIMASYEGASLLSALHADSHTHVERVTGQDLASKTTKSMPRIHVRRDEVKKYRNQNGDPKGRGATNDYYLPALA